MKLSFNVFHSKWREHWFSYMWAQHMDRVCILNTYVKSWIQQTREFFCGIHFKNKARSHTLNAPEQLVTIYVHKWRALFIYFFHLCFSIVSLSSFYTMHFQILSIYLVQVFFCSDIILFSNSFLHALWILSIYKLFIFF